MTIMQIETARDTDAHQVIAVLVLAFIHDPVARWFYADPHQYLIHFPDLVRGFAGKAFEQGTAHYVKGFSGARELRVKAVMTKDRNDIEAVLIDVTAKQTAGNEVIAGVKTFKV